MAQNRNGGSDDETQYIGPTQPRPHYGEAAAGAGTSQGYQGRQGHPRQYFPGEDEPAQPAGQSYGGGYDDGAYQGYYQGGYAPEPQPAPQPQQEAEQERRGGGAAAGVLGALLVLALLALGAVTYLWRSAASEADKPAPEPSTVTETKTETPEPTTVTETEEPDLSTIDPRDLLPSELPDRPSREDFNLDDLEGALDDLLGGGNGSNGGTGGAGAQGANAPEPAQ